MVQAWPVSQSGVWDCLAPLFHNTGSHSDSTACDTGRFMASFLSFLCVFFLTKSSTPLDGDSKRVYEFESCLWVCGSTCTFHCCVRACLCTHMACRMYGRMLELISEQSKQIWCNKRENTGMWGNMKEEKTQRRHVFFFVCGSNRLCLHICCQGSRTRQDCSQLLGLACWNKHALWHIVSTSQL